MISTTRFAMPTRQHMNWAAVLHLALETDTQQACNHRNTFQKGAASAACHCDKLRRLNPLLYTVGNTSNLNMNS